MRSGCESREESPERMCVRRLFTTNSGCEVRTARAFIVVIIIVVIITIPSTRYI